MKYFKPSPLLHSTAIVVTSLSLGLLFNYLFYNHIPGLAFVIYVGFITAGLAALAALLRQRPRAATWGLALPLLGFAALVAVRASVPLTLLNLGACLALFLLLLRTAFQRSLTGLHLAEYLRLPLLPLQFIMPGLRTLAALVATRQAYQDRPRLQQVLKGVALTLPVLALFLLLFASADLVVQKYAAKLLILHLSDAAIVRLIIIAIVSTGFLGVFSYLFGRTQPEPALATRPRRALLGSVESAILFVSVNLLFLAFILVQFAYLFGGQANISAQGFTYAEYARKGFFELLAVAVAAFVLLWLAERYVETKPKSHTLQFKLLASILIAQVIVVMASAFKRLYLYEQAYGFTTLRLFSHAATILLAAVLLLLAYKIIRSSSEQTFTFSVLVLAIVFLAGLNLMNPDAFIAQQNLDRFDSTGKIDAAYLGRLSDDATPVILSRIDSLPPADRSLLHQELDQRLKTLQGHSDWQSWNLSRSQASRLLIGR